MPHEPHYIEIIFHFRSNISDINNQEIGWSEKYLKKYAPFNKQNIESFRILSLVLTILCFMNVKPNSVCGTPIEDFHD